MKQLELQVEHLKGLQKERNYHIIEMNHYSKKVENLAKKSKGSANVTLPNQQTAAMQGSTSNQVQPSEVVVPLKNMSKNDRNKVKLKQAIDGVEEFV